MRMFWEGLLFLGAVAYALRMFWRARVTVASGGHSDLGGTGGREKPDVSMSTSTGRGGGEMEEPMGTSCDSAIAVGNVRAFEGGMLSSSRRRTSARALRRAHVAWLEQERRQCRSEEEFTTAISKPTWAQVAPPPSCSATGLPSSLAEGSSSCLSHAEKCEIQVTNKQFFRELIKKQPPHEPWCTTASGIGRILHTAGFFVDFGGLLDVGKKIAQGGQAEIYEACFPITSDAPYSDDHFVFKVIPLEDSERFRHAWEKGCESIYMDCNFMRSDTTCCFVQHCTLLKDGRFAFLMMRFWGDLRKAINIRILKDKTHIKPPFPSPLSTFIMYQIARGMRLLHDKGIVHRDLKAANVFVNRYIEGYLTESYEDLGVLWCAVGDFESSEGVLGTGFWRAPEVMNILKSSSKEKHSDPTVWTKKVDVYAYAMTCYEVLSGCIPFGTRAPTAYNIGDERPPLPGYVDQEIQELLRKCWDSDPLKRPTFEIICNDLKRFHSRKVKECEALAREELDVDAILWLRSYNIY